MTLLEARRSLAEHNPVVDALVGLVGLARLVAALAAPYDLTPVGSPTAAATDPPDDLVYALVAIARVGAAIETLRAAEPPPAPQTDPSPARRWLR
jgi:hypothetical protein